MKIKIIRNPLDHSSVEEIEVECLVKTVKQYFKESFPQENFNTYFPSVSGGGVPEDYIPAHDDEIVYLKKLGGGGGGTLSTIIGGVMTIVGIVLLIIPGANATLAPYLIAAGVGMMLSGVAAMFMQIPASGMENSQTYSWDGIQNIIGEGNVVPVVYGEHRVGGVIIEGYLDGTSGNGESDLNFLYMVTALSEGPIQEDLTETTEINGKLVWMYDNGVSTVERFYNFKTGLLEEVGGVIVNSTVAVENERKKTQIYIQDDSGGDDDDDSDTNDSSGTSSSEASGASSGSAESGDTGDSSAS